MYESDESLNGARLGSVWPKSDIGSMCMRVMHLEMIHVWAMCSLKVI